MSAAVRVIPSVMAYASSGSNGDLTSTSLSMDYEKHTLISIYPFSPIFGKAKAAP